MPVLLSVLPRPRLPKLVSPVLPVDQVLGVMEITVTPPLYDYLAFPSHERLPFALHTREGKVVRLPDWLILGSVLVAPSIDSEDPRAVYQRIAHDLRTQILSGDLPPGSALPSETELVRRYGSSRGPVRQAISLLRSEGLIDSHQGRGVFVRQRPTTRRLSIEGIADRTNGTLDSVEDIDGRLEVLRYTPTAAPAEVADRLALPEGARVLARRFRFFVEDRPRVSLDIHPLDLVKGTPGEDPEKDRRRDAGSLKPGPMSADPEDGATRTQSGRGTRWSSARSRFEEPEPSRSGWRWRSRWSRGDR